MPTHQILDAGCWQAAVVCQIGCRFKVIGRTIKPPFHSSFANIIMKKEKIGCWGDPTLGSRKVVVLANIEFNLP
jgi:hypothetical protein